MDYIYSIILATVQALTEFLPVSSSGHLVVLHQYIQSELLNSLTFDVILHAGTLLAVVVYFWQDVVGMVRGFFQSLFYGFGHKLERHLPWLIIIGTLPAFIVGYFFEDLIEQIFRSVVYVIIMLAVGGVIFILAEIYSKKNRSLDSMTFWDALVIGLFQVVAFIPGSSRSGFTIVAGLFSGFKREEAAKFSFLLSIPIILGATIRKITQISLNDFSLHFIFVSVLGAIVAALIGYMVIKFLLRFLQKNSLLIFAYYRFLLAAVLAVIFLL